MGFKAWKIIAPPTFINTINTNLFPNMRHLLFTLDEEFDPSELMTSRCTPVTSCLTSRRALVLLVRIRDVDLDPIGRE